MSSLCYRTQPSQVLFGRGMSAQIGAEAERLAIKRAVILTAPEQKGEGEAIRRLLGNRAVGLFSTEQTRMGHPASMFVNDNL